MFIDVKKLLSKTHTDKEPSSNYGELYNLLFTSQYSKVNRPLSVLELGVNYGGSAYAWALHEKVEKIVGLDTNFPPPTGPWWRANHLKRKGSNDSIDGYIKFTKDLHAFEKFSGERLDAYKSSSMGLIKDKYGKFDIIIDDGPHTMESQIFFLDHYSELLNDNGVLICEDVNYVDLQEFRDSFYNRDNTYIFDLRFNPRPRHSRGKDDSIIIIRYKSVV